MKKLISWVEIPAIKMERAVNFYNSIFNLDLEILDFGKEKMACFPNDEGAISFSPGFKPSSDGVLVSLSANEEINLTLNKIEIAGGKIIVPKTKIEAEGRGFFAIFNDLEGNRIGLHSLN